MTTRSGAWLARCLFAGLVLTSAGGCASAEDSAGEANASCVEEVMAKGANEADSKAFCDAAASAQAEEAQAKADLEAVAAQRDEEDTAEPTASEGVLPDVTGMDLQSAQDELQAAGYEHLDSIDDTGRGRDQILDSNWIVVDMLPGAGEEVSPAYEITLFVVKEDEA